MLFRKKDNSSGAKAKTSLFAQRATKEVHEVKDAEGAVVATKQSAQKDTAKGLKQSVASGRVNPNVLRNPRVTEKATMLTEHNVYSFDVSDDANKRLIAEAVRDVYRVTPVAVRIVRLPKKTKVTRKGLKTQTGGGKKAYVQLKKGDTIELV